MMRSLYSGVSGLRNHQTRMDVIGNNIANVNTVGFKASRTIFQDLYSQNMRSASSPGDTTGGTNPQQIGLGVTLATIDTLFTRSAAQVTGNTFDLMIENDGFFIVRNGDQEFYSRAGNFYMDVNNDLVTASGMYVMGYLPRLTQGLAEVPAIHNKVDSVTSNLDKAITGSGDTTANWNPTDKLNKFVGKVVKGSGRSYTVNFKADGGSESITGTFEMPALDPSASGDVNVDVKDAGGNVLMTLKMNPKKCTEENMTGLTLEVVLGGGAGRGVSLSGPTEPFTSANVEALEQGAKNNNKEISFVAVDITKNKFKMIVKDTVKHTTKEYEFIAPSPAATGSDLIIEEGGVSIKFTPNYDPTTLARMTIRTGNLGADKIPMGAPGTTFSTELTRIHIDPNLYSIEVDKNGNVYGLVRSDGSITDPTTGKQIKVEADQRVMIAKLGISTFENQQGLEKVGTNLYRSTSNSGEAQYKEAGVDGAGQINPGALEMSNVDLAQEFTDMIVTQRGFQANSRIITVSDTLLEELVNLKR